MAAPLDVCSFWVHRPDDFPQAADYRAMIRILDQSCSRLGFDHFVLTDHVTAPQLFERLPTDFHGVFARELPRNLMQACTQIQADWLEHLPGSPADTALVGADCIMLADPRATMPALESFDVAVTYRRRIDRYPINTGMVFIPAHARMKAAALYRRIAQRCGPNWCDDQRAIRAELEPMPRKHGIHERAGLRVAFLPMFPYNYRPSSPADPASRVAMVHFRGKAHKQLFFDWAEANWKRHSLSGTSSARSM